MNHLLRAIWPFATIAATIRHSLQVLETLMARGRSQDLLVLMLVFVAGFFLYTPLHELMHAGAAILMGGSVSELAIAPLFGGKLLARILPFVVAESEYAGQLTGFSVPNRLAYAVVDGAPYLLSLPGVALLEAARRRVSLPLGGLGFLVTWIPLTQFSGDFFEAWSLILSYAHAGLLAGTEAKDFVSDDAFRQSAFLLGQGRFWGIHGLLWLANLLLALLACCWLLAIQWHLARRLMKMSGDSNSPQPSPNVS